jgi:hypothetical protein
MTRFIEEAAKSIPIAGEYDVIVCGGGTSGVPAAVAAAREGARVALIERFGFVGGMPAYGIMPAWHGLTKHHSGLLTEFAGRMAEMVKGTKLPNPMEHNHMEPEMIKQLAMQMLLEAGVELHLHTMITGVVKEGETVKGIITESKSGRRAFLGKVIIDATGDGDAACYAGAGYLKGRADGVMQAMSLRFRVGYIDFSRFLSWVEENSQYFPKVTKENLRWIRERADEGLDFFMQGDLSALYKLYNDDGNLPVESYFNLSSIRSGEASINGTRIHGVDGTVEEDLTKAEISCRTQAYSLWRFLMNHIPGFENSQIIETAPAIGVRETRCIIGDYVLTEEDCRNRSKFSDAVMTSRLAFDIHDPVYILEVLEGLVDVPYRCFLPQGIDNILAVGRIISADHVTNSSLRKMEIVYITGQVGGIAAALSCREGVAPRTLPYEKLRVRLEVNGIELR